MSNVMPWCLLFYQGLRGKAVMCIILSECVGQCLGFYFFITVRKVVKRCLQFYLIQSVQGHAVVSTIRFIFQSA